MHTWLPDAHSQAPGPVSAVFSGFMLSSALYCLLRYFPLVEGIDAEYAGDMLIGFGVLSLLIAAAFVIYQKDVKRLLAYSSVEHIGIITLGIGLGPLGAQAALFHTFNHSICKTLGFFSAGRLGQIYGSHDMQTIRGALRARPLWGVGLLGSLLALIGVAPMSIFMSEFQLARAAIQNNAWWVLAFFLLGTSIIFISVIKRAIEMAFGTAPADLRVRKERIVVRGLVVVYLAFLLMFGIWMPEPMRLLIDQGAAIVVGAP
jgi:hydrogenase-4 component F